jgi:hypothetical protein
MDKRRTVELAKDGADCPSCCPDLTGVDRVVCRVVSYVVHGYGYGSQHPPQFCGILVVIWLLGMVSGTRNSPCGE